MLSVGDCWWVSWGTPVCFPPPPTTEAVATGVSWDVCGILNNRCFLLAWRTWFWDYSLSSNLDLKILNTCRLWRTLIGMVGWWRCKRCWSNRFARFWGCLVGWCFRKAFRWSRRLWGRTLGLPTRLSNCCRLSGQRWRRHWRGDGPRLLTINRRSNCVHRCHVPWMDKTKIYIYILIVLNKCNVYP